MVIFENIDIDIDKAILKNININIDKEILENFSGKYDLAGSEFKIWPKL